MSVNPLPDVLSDERMQGPLCDIAVVNFFGLGEPHSKVML